MKKKTTLDALLELQAAVWKLILAVMRPRIVVVWSLAVAVGLLISEGEAVFAGFVYGFLFGGAVGIAFMLDKAREGSEIPVNDDSRSA